MVSHEPETPVSHSDDTGVQLVLLAKLGYICTPFMVAVTEIKAPLLLVHQYVI